MEIGDSVNLRALARGKQCYMRLPTVCNFNPETTVLCHLRRGNTAGVGMKPSDLCALPMCSACHDALDGRTKSPHSRAQMDADALRGLCQWLTWLEREGYLLKESA